MRVLLDTHALLWALAGDSRLSFDARSIIENLKHEVLVSSASAWEIAVKRSLGKLEAPDDLASTVADAGFVARAVTLADCTRLQSLAPIHRDPFDRMLVAQAMEDGVPIVTRDPMLGRYAIQTIW